MNTNQNSTRNAVIVVILALIVLAIVMPIVIGWGTSLSYGTSENVLANAELQRAIGDGSVGQAQLAMAEAERFRGLSEALASAPQAITSGGALAMNIGLMVLIILAGAGIMWLLYSLGYTVTTRCKIAMEQSHAQIQIRLFEEGVTNPNVLPAVNTRPSLGAGSDNDNRDNGIVNGKLTDKIAEYTKRKSAGTSYRPGKFGVNVKPNPPAYHSNPDDEDGGITLDSGLKSSSVRSEPAFNEADYNYFE